MNLSLFNTTKEKTGWQKKPNHDTLFYKSSFQQTLKFFQLQKLPGIIGTNLLEVFLKIFVALNDSSTLSLAPTRGNLSATDRR